MILYKTNMNNGKTKAYETEYEGMKNDKARFKGYGGYIKNIGPYDIVYRLEFNNQKELQNLIEDLIELYNSRETDVEKIYDSS
jgi:hypothetical protein